MQEVLSLTYTPDGGLLGKVAVVKESEHVPGVLVRQLGVPEPQAVFTRDDMTADERAALDVVIAATLRIVNAKTSAPLSPDEVTSKAAELAAKEHAFASERRAREEEKARLEKQIADAQAAAEAEAKMADEARAARAAEESALAEVMAVRAAQSMKDRERPADTTP